jgi:rhamnosyltransferase
MSDSPGQDFCADVCAVVVTYHPDPDSLRALLPALKAQVGRVIVVDNGSAADVAQWVPPADADRVELVRNDRNHGLAAAQNEGAARAMAWSACRYVLFTDQDSLPAPHMVRRLRDALVQAARLTTIQEPAQVAAAGPQSIDVRTGEASVLIVDQWGWPGRWLPPERALSKSMHEAARSYDVSFLIASGSLVPVPVLRALRGMRSNYFIDHVDTEWCLRARAAGYRLVVVPEATLHHRIGDSVKRLWILGRRPVPYHSPLRDYYMFRNTLLMLRDVPMPITWRLHLVIRMLQFAGYFLMLGDQRRQRLRHMWLGVRHGLGRVSGRLDTVTRLCEAVAQTELDPVA